MYYVRLKAFFGLYNNFPFMRNRQTTNTYMLYEGLKHKDLMAILRSFLYIYLGTKYTTKTD